MSEQKALARRLDGLRRELDECAEWLGRIAKDVEPGEHELQLGGVTEIAAMLGVKTDTIQKWRARGIMPEPVAQLSCGAIWLTKDVEQWAARRAAA